MNAIILAAGRGSRLPNHLSKNPKCFLKLRKKPLINYQIESFYKIGIKDIEVEFLLGKISKTGSFNPNIDEKMYNRSMKLIEEYDMKKTIEYYVDAYSDELAGIRTRHIYSNDFKKFILLSAYDGDNKTQ